MTWRTVSVIGDTRSSGIRCTSCGVTYAACTRRIFSGHNACCVACYQEDTHDTHELRSVSQVRDAAATPGRKPQSHGLAAYTARTYADTLIRKRGGRFITEQERQRYWIDVYMRRYRALTGRPKMAGPGR